MRAIAIALALAMTVACSAAPVTHMIYDFEGELPSLIDDAAIVEMDGTHVLRWTPTVEEPWFLALAFSGAEFSEWDRLEFRYRIDGATAVDWWGVKVVDHRLAMASRSPTVSPPRRPPSASGPPRASRCSRPLSAGATTRT